MKTVRRADERFHTQIDWLDSHHSFSFGEHYDPSHLGFRALRVLNDDRVRAGAGFPTHPHRDMEIVSYVLEGALAHKDSMGNGSVLRVGDVQRMSAGTGVLHSEYNAERARTTHFLQIWLLPQQRGLRPGYEQKHFDEGSRRGALRLVASGDGRDGSVTVRSDAALYATLLARGERATHELAADRHAYVFVARGALRVGELTLREGDGLAVSDERLVELEGADEGLTEALLFDLG